MIDFYFWTTPNGYKVLMFLEEIGIPYRIIPVNISQGDQFKPHFLRISPNNKIPAIVDYNPIEDNGPITLFESGAILLYLAEKNGKFIPDHIQGRSKVLQWLFWQMGGLGPMLGQNLHFAHYTPEKMSYSVERYVNETARLFKVLDNHLADHEYIADEYSIADMASYPWIFKYPDLQQDLESFPNLKRWYTQVESRPGTVKAYQKGARINTIPTITEASKKFLLGQNAEILTA